MIREIAFTDIFSQEVTPDEGQQIRPQQESRAAHWRRHLTLIVATAADNAIGRGGDMLWHIGHDLRHFKELTRGATVIMGRKTWESLPKRPLPDRRNIVITRSGDYAAPGAEIARSLADALDTALDDKRVFIIGGGEIYRQTFHMADVIELTRINGTVDDADTFFPTLDPTEWRLVDASETFAATDSHPSYRFETWQRISSL